jgi:hypothetical protein
LSWAHATEVVDLAGAGEGGRHGGLKEMTCWLHATRATRFPNGNSVARAVLPSGVAIRSGLGLAGSEAAWRGCAALGSGEGVWAEGLGDRRRGQDPNPSYCGELFRAVPLEVGLCVAPVLHQRLYDLGVRPCVVAATAPMVGDPAWVID